jgi:hypothetical protein
MSDSEYSAERQDDQFEPIGDEDDGDITNFANEEMVCELEKLDKIDLDEESPLLNKRSRLKSKRDKKSIKGITVDKIPKKEIINNQQLKLSILQYKTFFPKHVESYNEQLTMEHLSTLTDDELTKLLDEIRVTVSCLNSASLMHHAYYGGCSILESVVSFVGVPMNGFTETISRSEPIKDVLNEISLQNNLVYVQPEVRLLFSTLAVANIVIRENLKEKNKRMESFATTKVDKNLFDNSKDL